MQDKLAQFQNLQNQLQMIAVQKQQLMLQSTDLENARKELDKLQQGKVYRMVGPVMVETNKDDGLKYLGDEKDTASAKLKVLEKQEKKLAEKLNQMRSEIQGMLQPPTGG